MPPRRDAGTSLISAFSALLLFLPLALSSTEIDEHGLIFKFKDFADIPTITANQSQIFLDFPDKNVQQFFENYQLLEFAMVYSASLHFGTTKANILFIWKLQTAISEEKPKP